MANYKEIKNVKVVAIQDFDQYDPQLIFEQSNPLNPEDAVQREIRLWTSKPDEDEPNEKVLDQRAKELGELLGDDSITFAATAKDADNSDVRNYLKKHAPVKVDGGIYQDTNKGYYRIGEPQTFDNSHSRYQLFKDDDKRLYDPSSQYMLIYDALDEATRTAFDEKDNDYKTEHSQVWVAKKGHQGVRLNNPIVNVYFNISNSYNDKDDVQETSKEDFLSSLLNKFKKASDDVIEGSKVTIEEVEDLYQKAKQMPESVSFYDVIELLGGKDTPNLHEDMHTQVQKWLRFGQRQALEFNVNHVPSNINYKPKALIAPDNVEKTKQMLNGNTPLTFEFFKGDLSRKDVVQFLDNANLVDSAEIIQDAIDEVLDGDIEKVTENIHDFLNYLFLNRRIETNSSNKRDDPYKMGTYINGFGDYYDVDYTKNNQKPQTEVSDEEIDDVIPDKQEQAPLTPDEAAEQFDNKKEEDKSNKEQPKEKDNTSDDNPWANANDNDEDNNDNPFANPSKNPFDI